MSAKTTNEIYALFDRLIAVGHNHTVAKKELEKFRLENVKPVRPRVVENLEEWNTYALAAQAYDQNETALNAAADSSRKEWENVSRELIATLPEEVWFHYKDYAIGVAYSDWGGSHYYADVRPWSADLPSLDQRYRGD